MVIRELVYLVTAALLSLTMDMQYIVKVVRMSHAKFSSGKVACMHYKKK